MEIRTAFVVGLAAVSLVTSRGAPSAAASASASATRTAPSTQLIVCGTEELYILDISSTAPKKVWSWRAAQRPELPEGMRRKFQTIAECKAVEGGARILITASSNGAAVIDRASGRVEFYATAMNAHSIELLPGNRVVVAASHVGTGPGDRLSVYDVARSDVELFHVDTPWPHGVIWDAPRKMLWADSQKDVVGYRLADWESATPRLVAEVVVPLPDINGHDMMPVPGTPLLTLATAAHTWLFDRDTHTLSLHPTLGATGKIKSIDTEPESKRVVWIGAQGESWWSDTLRFLNPAAVVPVPGEKIYKARWIVGR